MPCFGGLFTVSCLRTVEMGFALAVVLWLMQDDVGMVHTKVKSN